MGGFRVVVVLVVSEWGWCLSIHVLLLSSAPRLKRKLETADNVRSLSGGRTQELMRPRPQLISRGLHHCTVCGVGFALYSQTSTNKTNPCKFMSVLFQCRNWLFVVHGVKGATLKP